MSVMLRTRMRETARGGTRKRSGCPAGPEFQKVLVLPDRPFGAVTGVIWGRDSALDVTGTVPAVIAVAGCHPPSRRADGPGQVLLATPGSHAHATLACATEVATALRDTRRYASLNRYPMHHCRTRRWSRASRDPEVASSFQNVPRSKRPRCRANEATPPPAPGSCPDGSQAIVQ
jgi:hypothetical protein